MFEFNVRSALLLPFVLAGGTAAAWLLGRMLIRRTVPDALLALLLLIPTLGVGERMLYYAGWTTHPDHAWWLRYAPWHLGLSVGPAYYLYFRSLTNQAFRWRAHLWHLVPGMLQVAMCGAAALADQLYPGTSTPGVALLATLDQPSSLLGYGLLLGYSLWMLASYQRYRRYLDDNFSNLERLRFNGLRQLLGLQLLGLTLSVVFTGLDAVFDFSTEVGWIAFVLRGGLIYGLLVIGIESNYAAATNPLRFQAEPGEVALGPLSSSWPEPREVPVPASGSIALSVPLADSSNASVPSEAPAAAVLTKTPDLPLELVPWHTNLLHLMDTQQLWLEPDLNLSELARRVGIHPVLLSKVINIGCRQNFNDFVNAYRVAEARRKLTDPRYAHYSLLGIALECGFNSQSTFTRAYKKLTNELPSEATRVKL